MRFEPKNYSISDLIELKRSSMLDVNQEYQRGAVWSEIQKKKLIDSLLRGYPIPLFYFHHIKRAAAGLSKENFEIVDGQQRMDAIYAFVEGDLPLLNPRTDTKANFPKFVREQECPWAGLNFASLPDKHKTALMETQLPVVVINTDNDHEVRDLFVRLQSGLPLNAQETRDSWPGDFTDFILELGGKPSITRYPGHPFFQEVLKMKPGSDRGKTRQLAAQLSMVFLSRRESKYADFPDISSKAVTDFYLRHIDFDKDAENPKRLRKILDLLTELLRDGKRPKLHGHDAIHLVALADTLLDDYVPSWKDKLPGSLDKFLKNLADAKANRDSDEPNEYWSRYAQWTRVSSDRGETIARRHQFYAQKMLEFLKPKLKDPQRTMGELERTIFYFSNGKKCAVCDGDVFWSEAEVHHVIPYSKGGETSPENSALVHSSCHPKSDKAVKDFEAKFKEDRKLQNKISSMISEL